MLAKYLGSLPLETKHRAKRTKTKFWSYLKDFSYPATAKSCRKELSIAATELAGAIILAWKASYWPGLGGQRASRNRFLLT
jgi:hypothetical protein